MTLIPKQKQKYRGMFETRKSRNKTSSGDIGLNIRTIASPKVGQDQVSGGVSVPCRHATPVADAPWKPIFGEMSECEMSEMSELDLHRIMSGFHGTFATGVACQKGKLTLPDTWFRPPFSDLLVLHFLRPDSSNLPCLYSTFHLEYPLVLSRFCFKPYNKRDLYMLIQQLS